MNGDHGSPRRAPDAVAGADVGAPNRFGGPLTLLSAGSIAVGGLHPWCVLLLLVLVAFLTPAPDEGPRRWIDAAPWLLLGGLLVFSYLIYEDPAAFVERTWFSRLQWWPTLDVVAIVAVRHVLLGWHWGDEGDNPRSPVIMSP